MQLHQLSRSASTKNIQRVGRGGKRGTTSGRGQKGQKSRSGHRMRPAQRDILLRLAKRRGFANKPTSAPVVEIPLSRLVSKVKLLQMGGSSVTVDLSVLKQLGFAPARAGLSAKFKILGPVPKKMAPMALRGVWASASVIKAITDAGGSYEPATVKLPVSG